MEIVKILIALIAIVNPVGVIPFYVGLTQNMSDAERKRTIRTASLAVMCVIGVTAFAGEPLLKFFGISVGALEIAGGILMLLMSISMLNAQLGATRSTQEEADEAGAKASIAVVPLAIPLLTGPGTISTVIVYAGKTKHLWETAMLAGCGVVIGLLTFAALNLAKPIERGLGRTGINIATRLFGLMLAALAVELIIDGLKELLPILNSQVRLK